MEEKQPSEENESLLHFILLLCFLSCCLRSLVGWFVVQGYQSKGMDASVSERLLSFCCCCQLQMEKKGKKRKIRYEREQRNNNKKKTNQPLRPVHRRMMTDRYQSKIIEARAGHIPPTL